MKIEIEIQEYNSIEELPPIEQKLVLEAKKACKRAYAPHSGFHVGAAVLLEDDSIVSGNNQENIAYPSGICAERTTLFYAHAQHPDKKPKTIAVAAFQNGEYEPEPVTPCGACRQVMLETENRYKQAMRVIMVGENKIWATKSVHDLVPLSFDDFLKS